MAGLQLVVPESIQLHASSSSRAPELLKGRVELFVPEPTTISELTVDFVGTVSGRVNGAMASRELCKIGREVCKKKKLAGGLQAFSFAIPVFYNLPCSVRTLVDSPGRGFAIEYQVRALARVSKPKKTVLETRADIVLSSIHTTAGAPFNVPASLLRDLTGKNERVNHCFAVVVYCLILPSGIAKQRSVDPWNSRQDTIKYEIAVPHAAWAAGTTTLSRLSLLVIDPRVKIDSFACSLMQSVSATVKGGEVRFKQELAKHAGLVPGDNIVELAIPPEILLSYNPGISERGVKIEHTIDILLNFTDQSGRPSVLQSSVPLTLLDAKQKDDALVAGKQVEDWILHQVPVATDLVPAIPAGQAYVPPHYFPPVAPAVYQYPQYYQQQQYPQQQPLYPQQPPYAVPNQPMPQGYAPPHPGWQAPYVATAGAWPTPPAPQAVAGGPGPGVAVGAPAAPASVVPIQATPTPFGAHPAPPGAPSATHVPPIDASQNWQPVPQPPTQPPAAMGGSRPTWLNLTYLNAQAPPHQDGSSTPGKTLPALPPGAQPPLHGHPPSALGQNAQ